MNQDKYLLAYCNEQEKVLENLQQALDKYAKFKGTDYLKWKKEYKAKHRRKTIVYN